MISVDFAGTSKVVLAYRAKSSTEAYYVRGPLNNAGIDAEVRGEYSLFYTASVWILDDSQFEMAERLIKEYESGGIVGEPDVA